MRERWRIAKLLIESLGLGLLEPRSDDGDEHITRREVEKAIVAYQGA